MRRDDLLPIDGPCGCGRALGREQALRLFVEADSVAEDLIGEKVIAARDDVAETDEVDLPADARADRGSRERRERSSRERRRHPPRRA